MKQVLAVVAICGVIAACKFSASDPQDVTADSSLTDTTSVVTEDTTHSDLVDTVNVGE